MLESMECTGLQGVITGTTYYLCFIIISLWIAWSSVSFIDAFGRKSCMACNLWVLLFSAIRSYDKYDELFNFRAQRRTD